MLKTMNSVILYPVLIMNQSGPFKDWYLLPVYYRDIPSVGTYYDSDWCILLMFDDADLSRVTPKGQSVLHEAVT